MIPKLNDKQRKRFWSKIKIINEHWYYDKTHTKNRPRGVFCFNKKSYPASEVAWDLEGREKLKKGQLLINLCKDINCCRPSHLIITDRQALMSLSVGRGEKNKNCKLTNDLINFIRTTKQDGKSLAKKMGISQPLISNIRCGKIWKNI